MQYALIDEIRREAFPGGKGECPTCGNNVIAKCGSRVIHHWAHTRAEDCDPWWENETAWHRDWKNHFPESCREIAHITPDGEIHRCDIKTSTGIYIEIQHSPISDKERLSREQFYQNLVWVINGKAFEKNFDILHSLPDPNSDLAKDIVWCKGTRTLQGAAHGIFFRISENPGLTKIGKPFGWVHSLEEIKHEVASVYRGHHQYDWIRPTKTWLSATCPVYIDFGRDFLLRLETYDESDLPCVRVISKSKFLLDVATQNSAKNVVL